MPCHDNENGLKGAAVALFVFTFSLKYLNSLYRAVMGLECQEIRVWFSDVCSKFQNVQIPGFPKIDFHEITVNRRCSVLLSGEINVHMITDFISLNTGNLLCYEMFHFP